MTITPLPLENLPPKLAEVLDYWRGLGGETLGCSWKNFDLMRLPAVLIPSTMVIDVGPTMDDNRYRFWGSHMTAIRGRDMTGENPYRNIEREQTKILLKHHKQVIDDGIPRASIYSFKWDSGVTHQHYSLRLPLSDDGVHVHQLVVCIFIGDEGPGDPRGILAWRTP